MGKFVWSVVAVTAALLVVGLADGFIGFSSFLAPKRAA